MYSFLFLFFFLTSASANIAEFPHDFKFGVSNASTQVEDKLNDPWMEFALSGRVSAFLNQKNPQDKIRFWTEPEKEIRLAKELGVKVFRMSIDWQRLVPKESDKVINIQALDRYKNIIKMINAEGMEVMLTLFHHSAPDWVIEYGGWTNPKVIDHFVGFSVDVIKTLNPYVTYWNTFNEPNVYAMFSYVAGIWPPGIENKLAVLNFGKLYKGDFFKALDHMIVSHNKIYSFGHKLNKNIKIGIAHNTAYYENGSLFSFFATNWSWDNMNYYFPDGVASHLDFMGINYYGSEFMTMTGIHFDSRAEYNDAGRAINPTGLYKILKTFYKRYKHPIFITENGTADADDYLRSSYLVEHLLAVSQGLKDGIPIMGYIQWSLTDNFEWADGYCPKFGLVEIVRSDNEIIRKPRESFYFFKDIIKSKTISKSQRDQAWSKVKSQFGKQRKMCRAANAKDSLDSPRSIPFRSIDWRFKSPN